MISTKLPFAAHALVETAAALSFIFRPEKQLPACTPAAKLILRQYGGLLLATNLVCIVILAQPSLGDNTIRLLAAALGSYHLWPCYRAYIRIAYQVDAQEQTQPALGGPSVHLVVHLLCLAMFVRTVLS
ncbi:hypothetical protein GGS23DRAFT_151374 [Durotheca rogersii]|uniref:uncharacterized protein n=1 Tax=Durotheca rogersii TaxID=419775 RepID=UPI002220AF34|nr:uncharacterized protein GGS23DRAFT_151374 [Durotheca rogersii]KAI5861456.1 hypothetical protein GGS23DRAFT_151374 [Durotheca rogersii]